MAAGTSTREGPLRLSRVLYEEHRHVFRDGKIDDPGKPRTQDEEDAALYRVFTALHGAEPMALCISGGGIRSATFALGVLQGLAQHGMLRSFHYLSTVSGGGYIGSWLSAWIHRFGIAAVEETLARKAVGTKTAAESPQVDHLREYSNYLTPRLGLLSADTWAIVATVARNLLLNWLVLLPLLAAVVIVPQLVHAALIALLARDATGHPVAITHPMLGAIAGVALFGVVMAIAYMELDLPSGGNRRLPQGTFLRWCLLPLVAAAVLLTAAWALLVVTSFDGGELSDVARTLRDGDVAWIWFAALGAAVHVTGWAIGATLGVLRPPAPRPGANGADGWTERPTSQAVVQWLAVPISGAFGGVGLWLAIRTLPLNLRALVSFGPPVLLLIFLLAMVACTGLMSGITNDDDREWWARCGGWILIAALGWLVVSTVALYGAWALSAANAYVRAAVVSAGGLGAVATFLAGRSAKAVAGRRPDKEPPASGGMLDLAVKVGAPVFLVVLFLVLAWLADWLPRWWLTITDAPPTARGIVIVYLCMLGILVVVGALASRTVDINRFSLHAMYRNRLIRAYLGASRPREGKGCRRPHPFTGLDPKDNLPLRDLLAEEPPKDLPAAGRQLPFHVVNVALNLVKGTRLAWQHRKAASFTFSPLHGGSSVIIEEQEGPLPVNRDTPETIAGAYQPIAHYGGADGVTLGTALAISGAAVSPNMGYHSSPVVTFLLALLNTRLGWWLANPGTPGKRAWAKAGPRTALGPYLAEAFGLTTDRNEYVYLSDGGHFDNLGLYEMVLRRCARIVVVDGGCDPTYQFEDLGNAIRKIRIDLGIPIEFATPLAMTREVRADNKPVAIGTIDYRVMDGPGAPVGTLVYVKPVLNGGETVDVRNYKALHDAFPHESTGDQFFDEDQFESYRMLGRYCVEEVVRVALNGRTLQTGSH